MAVNVSIIVDKVNPFYTLYTFLLTTSFKCNHTLQVEQLDKLEQYTTPATKGVTAEDGELGELSQKFYQAAVQVCVGILVKSL